MRKSLPLAILMSLLLALPTFSVAKNVYIAQTTAGSSSGADCANAHPATWFNTATNWGGSAAQITAGDTVHLCGTFSTALNVQASGSAAAHTTIVFESGAAISLPYCPSSGCIGLGDFDYITIDGGNNGMIQSTANGTAFANKQYSNGIFGGKCSDIEIKNLSIRNIYVRTSMSTDNGTGATNSSGIFIEYAHSNIKVHDNTIPEAHTGIGLWTDTGTFGNWEVYGNTVSENVWGLDIAGGYSAGQLDGAYLHDNTIFDNDHWWEPADNFHTDPIFVRAPNSAGSLYRNVYIYNNFIHGKLGYITGYIFLSQYSNGPTYVFNNVMNQTGSPGGTYACPGEGAIAMQWNGTDNYYIYNNTIDGRSVCGISNSLRSTNDFNGTYLEWKNNVNLNTMGHWVAAGTFLSDYNVWFQISNASGQAFATGSSPTFYAWPNWQAAARDQHSITSDPKVNSDYTLQTGSPAIGIAQNLTSICQGQPIPGLGALCLDKKGTPRPNSGSWDAGAYQYSQATQVAPPSGLTAIVN